MTLRTRLAFAAGLAAICLPFAASAQSWGGDYANGWARSARYGFRGYPEFRDETAHIRQEIHEGLEEGWLDEDAAEDFNRELGQIQSEEAQEFREHGWDLPDSDRAEIRSSLNSLDHEIDEARDEP